MKEKSFLNHPIFELIDRFTKAILFHLLFWSSVILSLGLLMVPALTVFVLAIKSLFERSDSIVKTWIANLKYFTKELFFIGLIFNGLFLLFGFNTVFFYLAYQKSFSAFHALSAFFNFLIVLYLIKVVHHYSMLSIHFLNLTKRRRISYAFKMPFVMMSSTVISLVVFIISIIIVIALPYLLLIIFPLWEIIIFYLLTKKNYHLLLSKEDQPYRFDMQTSLRKE